MKSTKVLENIVTMAMVFTAAITAAFITGCQKQTKGDSNEMDIRVESFGETNDGKKVDRYTLTNANGMTVKIINYGGIVTELLVPDRNGTPGDVVLGFDSLAGYLGTHPYFGCVVGRYANRIAKGTFELDGKRYRLATNNNGNHLHGGLKGFDKAVWNAWTEKKENRVELKLTHVSEDGDEGYPGTLSVTVVYALNNKNELSVLYRATTTLPTIVNLSHHSYFNLAGAGTGNVLGHEMVINADRYTVVNDALIPTGELRNVERTPLDFRKPFKIGARIKDVPGGYDHNYVLNRSDSGLTLAATVLEPTSGRVMEVLTSEPGMQFYSGNFLDGSITGKRGAVYQKHFGFCLETQHFPDSPNQPGFPPVVLRPGQEYQHECVYRFSVQN